MPECQFSTGSLFNSFSKRRYIVILFGIAQITFQFVFNSLTVYYSLTHSTQPLYPVWETRGVVPNPSGRVFAPFWSENEYTLCPFWSGIGYGFRGNYGVDERIYRFNYIPVFQMSKKKLKRNMRIRNGFEQIFLFAL